MDPFSLAQGLVAVWNVEAPGDARGGRSLLGDLRDLTRPIVALSGGRKSKAEDNVM